MKYLPLIWAGLWRKRARTIFTLLSIVVAFVLFGILQGVDASMEHVMSMSRLDRLYTFTRYDAPLPISYLEQIQSVPGVTLVAVQSGIGGYWQDPKNNFFAAMTDERYFAAHPELQITKSQIETLAQTRTGIVVTTALANRYGWKVGDKIPMTANGFPQKDGSKIWTFDVLSIVDDADFSEAQFGVGNYKYLDESRAANAGTAFAYVVRIKDRDQAAQIGQAIDKLFTNSGAPTRTQTERANMQSNVNSNFDISFFIKAVVGAVFFTLLFLTANTMMQSIRERIPEFAVLKTMGYSDAGVLALVLAESVLICVIAALAGLGIAKFLIPLAKQTAGPFAGMPPIVFLYGIVAALLVALVSGLLPAWRAKRLVIVDALAGR